jgi:hypothetical protein
MGRLRSRPIFLGEIEWRTGVARGGVACHS